MKRLAVLLAALVCCAAVAHPKAPPLPAGFVYLSDVAPGVVLDVRYAGSHNLVGRALPGYNAPVCILTKRAAQALAKAEAELTAADLTLHVYDCYRPARAVKALLAWSRNAPDQRMKDEYYPRVAKSQLFPQGYLSANSAHMRGSSVDLSVQRLSAVSPNPWVPGQHSCIAPFVQRYRDGSIDMGTSYDCMDPISRMDEDLGGFAGTHRIMLRDLMEKYGFRPDGLLWWGFTLTSEPFPKTNFDFPIVAR